MSRFGKIARRTFLFGTVAVAGGVAFGYYKMTETPPNPLAGGEGATLNPYIIIDADGVTIIAPRAEMGQGVQTTLPALVAEELDIDLADVRVIHGPPAKAYFNQALLGAAIPVHDYARKPWQDEAAKFLGNAAKFLDMQVTGGSSSTKDAYERMRLAGASAREMLKQAAANRLGVDIATLRTEGGQVIAADSTMLAYTDLASDAAALPAPDVELRPRTAWKVLGKDQPRTDMVGKSTGTATFGIDVRLPDMKFATVRMSPRREGMVSFDPSDALLMDGVEKIIDLGMGFAVVASNTWLAFQAADAVIVEWAEASYPAETEDHFAAIAAAFDTEPNTTARDEGDVSVAVPNGIEITAEFRAPYLAHATMEPMNATALRTQDSLTVWCGNQGPVLVRNACAAAVGLEPEQVTVHTTLMGGGFGRRGEFDFAVLAARVAHEMPDTPVQVTWTREEDMRHDFYRPAAMARMRGVVADGKAVVLDGQIASPSVSHQAMARWLGREMGGPDAEAVAGAADQPLDIPNFRIRGHLADLTTPMGFWRSVGSSYNAFFFDCFIDEMAAAAGRDPLEFRLELVEPAHAPSAEVIRAVGRMSDWDTPLPEGRARGVGFCYSFGTPTAAVVEIADNSGQIAITNCWIVCDPGIALDPRNIAAQMTGGALFGLSAAAFGEITFEGGEATQFNFPDYESLRMHNAPAVSVEIIENSGKVSGVGEPGTPPAMAALANAVAALTGTRPRALPLRHDYAFVV